MKFSITRKINLSNIDKDLWPYETEDISVSDADSFEEAQQKADQLVAERTGYYKRISEEARLEKVKPAPLPIQPTPTMVPPIVTPTPQTGGIVTDPPAAPLPVAPTPPAGVNSAPPAEFNT